MPKSTKKSKFMSTSKSPVATWVKKHKKNLIIITAVAVTIVLVRDVTNIGSSYTHFYAKWIECKQKPVVSGVLHKGMVQHYIEVSIFYRVKPGQKMFCTPRDAELAGYSSNESYYELNNITTEEWTEILRSRGVL